MNQSRDQWSRCGLEPRPLVAALKMSRQQLITDWQQQLTAAETEPVGSSPRRAWLARVRTRLYRLLLSLYGNGTWRAADERPVVASTRWRPRLFSNTEDAKEYGGKPAKDAGKIRTVLKAVANSQDHRPQAGSLTAAKVLAHEWFVVAAVSSNLCLQCSLRLLQRHGIECQSRISGDDVLIEAPAAQRSEAMDLLDEHRAILRHQHNRHRPQRLHYIIAGLLMILVGPVVCLGAGYFISSIASGRPLEADTIRRLIVACGATTCISAGAIAWSWWRRGEHGDVLDRQRSQGGP